MQNVSTSSVHMCNTTATMQWRPRLTGHAEILGMTLTTIQLISIHWPTLNVLRHGPTLWHNKHWVTLALFALMSFFAYNVELTLHAVNATSVVNQHGLTMQDAQDLFWCVYATVALVVYLCWYGCCCQRRDNDTDFAIQWQTPVWFLVSVFLFILSVVIMFFFFSIFWHSYLFCFVLHTAYL